MASKPVTAMNPDDDKNDDFKMPEEFEADPLPNGEGALSADALNSMGFNDTQDELERQKMNPPVGDWDKEDRWEYEKRVNSEDRQVGDIDGAGRTFLIFKGKPKSREANGLDYEPMLFLRISPDKRYKQDKPTEVDSSYKLFLKVKDMYIEKKGEKVKNFGQLKSMLEEDSYVVRTMNGDNGAIVVDVRVKRQRNSR